MITGLVVIACTRKPPTNNATQANANRSMASKTPGPLPDRAFKAQVMLIDPPAKLRTGQKETIAVKVKNASDVFWWSRGGAVNDGLITNST